MKPNLLIVDDEQVIREVLYERLSSAGYPCAAAANSNEALARLRNGGGFSLVLTDIDMPGQNGIALLKEIKSTQPDVDVVMVTGVVDVDTAIQSIRMGASDYLTKPFNLDEVLLIVERTLEKRRLIRENREYQQMLEQRVEERTHEVLRKSVEVERLYKELKTAFEQIRSTYDTTLEALMEALDTRDTETQGHSRRVSEYTVAVAREMGVQEPELTQMRWGALLHDVGKIGVPDAILRKPAALTPEEWIEMRKHPELGRRILAGIRFLEGAVPIVYCHQERYDGTGYPRGLKGDQIPLGARIFAVVDTLDAMTMNRPYRKALPYERARQEVIKFSGQQFDPAVVEHFLKIPEQEWEQINRRIKADLAARGMSHKY
ncbi:MAG TPA: HD domain-containing phosphohydrolase [Candidatus Polarisedimenticolia bacterium]|nr:HD domain-containing phosphohydrolase [Candidatus Polarisedimenticolia bacterium]